MLVYNSLQNYNKKSIYASKTYNFNKNYILPSFVKGPLSLRSGNGVVTEKTSPNPSINKKNKEPANCRLLVLSINLESITKLLQYVLFPIYLHLHHSLSTPLQDEH